MKDFKLEKLESRQNKQGEKYAKNKKLKKEYRALFNLFKKVLVIGVILVVLSHFVFGVHICHSNNMFPSIKDGDLVITYKLQTPYNGDVVTYQHAGDTYIGRVVGIESDVIDFTDSGYMINGGVPYELLQYKTEKLNGDVEYPYTVKKGELFVLSDYREDGQDSRIFGAIKKTNGVVLLVIRRRGF